MSKKIGAIIALDGEKEFKAAVASVNKELSGLKSESALVTEEFKGQGNTLEALKKKQEVLQKTLDAQKKKEEEIRKGLENAKKSYDKVGSGLETLRTRYEKATAQMDVLKRTSGTTEDELESQQKEIDELAAALKKGEKNFETAANRVQDWESKLNYAAAQTIKVNRELENNAKYLHEAETSTDKCAKSIDEYGKTVKEQTDVTIGFGEAVKVAVAGKAVDAFTGLAKTAADASIGTANDIATVANQVQASTGAAQNAANEYKKVMKEVYSDNYGDNFEDVGEAIQTVVQNLKDIDSSELKSVTENAITLKDTFGFDYQEQIRAVKMMMDTFGVSSQKAFNLIAQGAQNGLNKNGDLLDTINEYSVHYKQMGVDADGFVNSLTNGAAAGTFSIDKLGDAYKEFGIRVRDTASSTTEGFELIELDADEMRARFAAGGKSAQEATAQVLDALFSMDDQVKQNQAGVDLFGTMWEDLGVEGVKALTNVNGEIQETEDAMKSIQKVKYSATSNEITQLARTFQMKIAEPLERDVLPTVNKGLNLVGDNLEAVETAVVGLGAAIALYKFSKTDVYLGLASTIKKVATATSTATTATKGAAAAQALWNAALNVSPIGLAVTAIAAVTAGIVAYKIATKNANSETAQAVKATKDFCETANEQIEAINNTSQAYRENTNETQAHWEANRLLIDQLYELNAQEEKTSGQKAVMRGIVNELKEDIPELAAAFNEQTGSISMTREELEKLIDKNEEYYLMIAAQDALGDFAKDVADAQIVIKQTEAELDKLAVSYKEYGVALDENYEREFVGECHNHSDEVKGLNRQYVELKKTLDNAKEAEADAQKNMETAKETLADYKYEVEDTTETVEDMSKAEEQAADTTQEAVEEQQEAYAELEESIRGSIKNSISLLEEFSGGTEITSQEILHNLNSQIEGMTNWADNMETLAGAAGEGMTEEFYAYLAEMGPESANMVQALVDSLKNNTGEFKQICEAWGKAMDLETPLTNQTTKALKYTGDKFGQGCEDIGTEAIESMQAGVAGAQPMLEVQAYDTFRAGMEQSRKAVKETQPLLEAETYVTFRAGIDHGRKAMSDKTGDLNQTTKDVLQKGVIDPMNELPLKAEEFGKNVVTGLGNGILANQSAATGAMGQVAAAVAAKASSVLDIHSPSRLMKKYGGYVTAGLAIGISGAKTEAESAIRDVCEGVSQTATSELDIHSPSRKFRDAVGKNIPRGIAKGIDDEAGTASGSMKRLAKMLQKEAAELMANNSTKDPVTEEIARQRLREAEQMLQMAQKLEQKELKEYSKAAYKSANAWYSEYKKTHTVTLQDEKYFWSQVSKSVLKGTDEYTKALGKVASIEKYENTIKNKVKSAFDVSWYTTGSDGKSEKKNAEDYYSELYSAASKYMNNYSVLHNVSLQQEEYYWQQVLKKMQKGTQGYIDATKQLKDVQSQIKDQVAQQKQANKEYALSGGALDVYKTYYKTSERAEVQYWDIVRKKFKTGTAERLQADQKYYEAKEAYNEKLESLNDDYYDNCKELNEKLEDDIAELTDAYTSAVADRKDSIYSSFDLFDEFSSTSKSGKTLLYNLKSQVAGIADWEQQLEKLGKKGILSDGLMKELQEMGPEASASIHALNQLSNAELAEYEKLYEQKNALAESQAVKENEELRKQTKEQISELKKQTKEQLKELKEEYKEAVSEVKKGIEAPLRDLAKQATKIGEDAVISLVAGIKDNAEKKSTKADLKTVSTKISSELGKLPKAGKTIGNRTLQGILDGLYDQDKINASAKSLINGIKKAIQKAADIHSPSRLFKKEIGVQLGAGVRDGLEDETQDVQKAGTDMIKALLDSQTTAMQKRQETVRNKLAEMDADTKIAAANQTFSSTASVENTVSVDNSGLIGKMEEMIAIMQQGFESLGNLQLVTDTGAMIGEMQQGMSESFAQMWRSKRR